METISDGGGVDPILFLERLLPSEGVPKKGKMLLVDLVEKRVDQLREKDRHPLAQQSAQISLVREKTSELALRKKAKDEIFERFKEACEQWKLGGGSEKTRLLLKQIGKSIKSKQNVWLTEAEREDLCSQYHALRTRKERIWDVLKRFVRAVLAICKDLEDLTIEGGPKEKLLQWELQVTNDLAKWVEQDRDKEETSDAEVIDKWEHFFDYYDQLIQLGPYDPAIEKAQQRYNELYHNLVEDMEQVFATVVSGWVGKLGEPFVEVQAIGDCFKENMSCIISDFRSKGKSKYTFQVYNPKEGVDEEFVVKIRHKLQAGEGYVEVSQKIDEGTWKRVEARAVLTQHVAGKVWDRYAYAKLLKQHRKTPEGEREFRQEFIAAEKLQGIPFVVLMKKVEKLDKDGNVIERKDRGRMPLASKGNLFVAREELSFEAKTKCARQMATGFAAMHERNLLHRDIKLENILLMTGDQGEEIGITDFGTMCDISDTDEKFEMAKGTIVFWAPELFRHIMDTSSPARGRPTKEMDIYSFGLTLAKFFYQDIVKNELTSTQPIQARGRRNLLGKIEKWIEKLDQSTKGGERIYDQHKQVHTLISSMIKEDPDDRPTAAEVKGSLEKIFGPLEDRF